MTIVEFKFFFNQAVGEVFKALSKYMFNIFLSYMVAIIFFYFINYKTGKLKFSKSKIFKFWHCKCTM